MYYAELFKFPHNILIDEFQIPTISRYMHKIHSDSIKSEVINILKEYNLKLLDAWMFVTAPNSPKTVHSDIRWDFNTNSWVIWNCSLNLTLEDTDSTMYWFSVLDEPIYPVENIKNRPELSNHNEHYANVGNGIHYGVRFNKNYKNNPNYSILKTTTINKPTLIRTHIPHVVENLDTKNRHCVSLRFEGNPTFEECLEKLENFI
jgi:hypothetical protein